MVVTRSNRAAVARSTGGGRGEGGGDGGEVAPGREMLAAIGERKKSQGGRPSAGGCLAVSFERCPQSAAFRS